MEQQTKQKSSKTIIIIIILVITILAILCTLFATSVINYKSNNTHNSANSNNQNTENNNSDKNDNDKNQQDCEKNYSMMYNDKYIYKVIVSNENGAQVYDSYNKENQNIVDTIEKGKEIGIVADIIDSQKFYEDNKKESYEKFEEIKDYYYYAIDVCGEPRYIKYNDVSIINSSIVLSNKFDKTQKVYVHDDEYLFSGPGLAFELNDNTKKISKGTILNIDTYSRIGNAVWLLVNSNNYNGWIVEQFFNSVNYPYNNMKYGSAVILNEKVGDLTLDKETNLYKYAFSTLNDEIILKIPSDTKIKYDYSTGEPGISYYHVNYNGNDGWIVIDN